MKIFIDRFLSDQYLPGDSLYIKDLIAELARRNPMHSFVMLAQEQIASSCLPPNITIYRINSFLLKRGLEKWWYRYILPATLKRLNADMFICSGNLNAPSAQIPSCLFLPALQQENLPDRKSRKQNGNRLHAACRRSRAVITFSRYDMDRLLNLYPVFSGRIKRLEPDNLQAAGPLTPENREAAKNSYANGLEYFAFAGDLHGDHLLTALLKAFSIFKKWQLSNMQLVITGATTGWTDVWVKSLESYKYRNDIHVIRNPSVETSHEIIAGAYAFVYPARHNHLPVPVIYAMQAEVPVVTSSIPVIEEIAGQAALYVSGNDENGFAKGMQTVYKDEQLRDRLINRGKEQRNKRGHDIVQDCWHILEKLSDHK